jgi:N-formylglutamate amidohydrolase
MSMSGETARAVVVTPPRGAARPLLVEVPHAGVAVPGEVRPELLLDEDGVRRDADLYVDRLYREAPALGATLIHTEVSRFVVDLNRDPGDVDARAVADHPHPRADAPRGLIWRVATDGTQALAAPLSLASYQRRVERYHAPYHAALDGAVAELRARFGRVIVLSGHSMPSVGKATHADPGRRRADVVPGDRRGTSCAPSVTRAAIELFTDAGFSVSPNDPYLGGDTTRRLGRPAEGLHALQIELNRDVYMDEATFAVREHGFARLQSLCSQLVERLAALAERL